MYEEYKLGARKYPTFSASELDSLFSCEGRLDFWNETVIPHLKLGSIML